MLIHVYDNHSIKHLGPRITAVRSDGCDSTTTNERLPAEQKERLSRIRN